MFKRIFPSIILISFLLFSSILSARSGFVVGPVTSGLTSCYLSVPFYYQDTGYYCGPASLEMVFNFCGPDIPQFEIADAANTNQYGTTCYDMVRAAHFSNLSTSVGSELPWNITGYSARKLGYAAFQRQGMSLEELKSLIVAGYPIIVCMQYSREWTNGHFRVVVGYNETHVTVNDPWFYSPYWGPNVNMSSSEFLYLWQFSDYCGLLVSPWNVSISVPENVEKNGIFRVTATIMYPCPPPFPTSEYSASPAYATITLPEGLELLPNETLKKPIGQDRFYPGDSATTSWTVKADMTGMYAVSVESEGTITGLIPYSYEDKIGGSSNITIQVKEASTAIPGDLNHDGTVDILDIVTMASIYGCREGDSRFNPEADLAPPYGIIDIFDVVTCASHYKEKARASEHTFL